MSARGDIRLDERREAAVAWCLRLADGPLDEAGREAFQAWLDDGNFDAEGRQRKKLGDFLQKGRPDGR